MYSDYIRNVAIIAHVDHGKTTLVDKIIHQCEVLDPRKEKGEVFFNAQSIEIIPVKLFFKKGLFSSSIVFWNSGVELSLIKLLLIG